MARLAPAGLALHAVLVGVANGASLRSLPGHQALPFPNAARQTLSLSHLNASRLSSLGDADPPWSHTCNRNTGRVCESPALDHGQSVVDYMGQCKQGFTEACSAGDTFPAGYCICTEGFCANGKGKCVEKEGIIASDSFQIYTRKFGSAKLLYMHPNGEIKLGDPPHPMCAQWKISINTDGSKNFYTTAYPDRLMDPFERCVGFGEQVHCDKLVGSAEKPPALETGWKIDHTGVYGKRGSFDEEYVTLRDVHSGTNLFIHPITFVAQTCSIGESMSIGLDSVGCPGDLGEFFFTPTIHNRIDVWITDPPPSTMHIVFNYIGGIMIVVVLMLVCCINTRLDQKNTRLDDGPLTQCLKAICCTRGNRIGGGLYQAAH